MLWFGPRLRAALEQGELSIALTGAGSWLGRAFLETLAEEGLLPPPSRLRLFASAARWMRLGDQAYAVEPLAGAAPLSGGSWLLLHFAFLGKERSDSMSTADFVAANAVILQETLRIAEPADDLRVVFSSSGAAYSPGGQLVDEPEDSPYGWCKVMQEQALAAWCVAHGAPLVIPRIFSIGGPWMNKIESYALSSFILAAQRTGVIRIMARRPVFRSFVHVAELNGLLAEAALAQAAETPLMFDTAGLETVEMADLAATVAAALLPATVRIERDTLVEGSADYYVGNGLMYRTLLAHADRRATGLGHIVRETVTFLERSRLP